MDSLRPVSRLDQTQLKDRQNSNHDCHRILEIAKLCKLHWRFPVTTVASAHVVHFASKKGPSCRANVDMNKSGSLVRERLPSYVKRFADFSHSGLNATGKKPQRPVPSSSLESCFPLGSTKIVGERFCSHSLPQAVDDPKKASRQASEALSPELCSSIN